MQADTHTFRTSAADAFRSSKVIIMCGIYLVFRRRAGKVASNLIRLSLVEKQSPWGNVIVSRCLPFISVLDERSLGNKTVKNCNNDD